MAADAPRSITSAEPPVAPMAYSPLAEAPALKK
jgi:hypothetical protein